METPTKKLSRQRKWQLKKVVSGKCAICGEPIFKGEKCKLHWESAKKFSRDYYRKKVGIPLDSEPWECGMPTFFL